MFIKAITTSKSVMDGFVRKDISRTSTFGRVKDKSICIDTWKDNRGKTFLKRIVLWNDQMQKIVNKVRNSEGKFDRIG